MIPLQDFQDPLLHLGWDLLFAAVNLSRFLGHDPEQTLHATVAKFVRRFRDIERRAEAEGRKVTDYGLAELDAFWEDAKRSG